MGFNSGFKGLRVSHASSVTNIRDNKFGLPEICCRSHRHNSVFPGYLLSCLFFSLTHFYPLIVGVEVILAFDHTEWHAHTRRTVLDRESARRRTPYLTTHITHKRRTIMRPAKIETAISDRRPTPWTMQQSILVSLKSCVFCRWYK